MWCYKDVNDRDVTWYSEEEYNELKKENETLKKLLEAHKILLEAPINIKGFHDEDM